MAIQWGTTDQKQRNGIDITVTAESSEAIRVDVEYYTQSREWGFNDSQTMTLRGHFDKVINFTFSTPSGSTTTRKVHTESFRWEKRYSGGPTYSFGAKISGQYLGGTPDVVRSFTVPTKESAPPNAPTINLMSVDGRDLSFSWAEGGTNGAAITQHQIQISTSSSFTSYDSIVTTNNYATFTSLLPSTTYYARARSDSSKGWSSFSGTRSISTQSPPSAPTAPTFSEVGGTSITWGFSAPSSNGGQPITSYGLQVSADPSFRFDATWETTGTSTSRTSGSLTPGTTYYARVRAGNKVGWGSWSGTRSVTTLGYPSAPGTPYITVLGPDFATIAWAGSEFNGGTPIIEYQIQVALDAAFSIGSSAPTTGLSLSRQYVGLLPGRTYYARARSRNAVGWGNWSGVRTFQTLSGAKVLSNGSWVNAKAYVLVNGVWTIARVQKRVNGAWVL